ncbi:MAG: restriction endonuclease subunit S [Bacteroides sp.]|nr:restriction endonuclease subunit S [Bacteroides sp.]
MLSLTIYRQCTTANSYYEKNLATGSVRCIDEEIPFGIPQGWEWSRIGNIFLHTSGKQQSRNNTNGTPHEFITTSNLYWGYFKLDNVKVMNFTDEEVFTCSATKGDLLVCEGGAGYGRSAIWNKDYDICLQNHVHRLRPIVKGLCEFVYYLIYYLKESNQLVSVGTAMPGLSANRLKEILVPVPPLKEQHKIVEKLQSVAPLLDRYTKSQTDFDSHNLNIRSKFHRSILQEAIQGKLVPQIEEEGTAEELLAEIRAEKQRLVKEGKLKKSAIANESRIFRGDDNKYYEQIGSATVQIECEYVFPKSWSVIRLSSVCALLDGEKIDGQFICMDAKYLRGKSSGEYLNKGRFVSRGMSIILVDGENSGEIFIVPHDGYLGSTFKQLWISNKLHIPYVLNVIRFYKDLFRQSKRGAAIPHLNKEVFNNLMIGLPPLKEQVRIVKQVEKLFETIQ